ncbi:MAG TPA: hypothetical protein PLQ97_09395 [Myxococcota bacterium]|nr:hypothetical protein [Myxococcota bacterium]HQK50993.1 hypothetical protein [Myxococcota bacterium]
MGGRLLVLVALAGMAFPCRAQTRVGSESVLVVLDSYLKGVDGQAVPDYGRLLAEELRQTGRFAVLERQNVQERFRAVLIVPPKRMQEERLSAIEGLIRQGDDLLYSDPQRAVDVLSKARQELEALAEGMAVSEKVRTEYLKAQMLLARSHLDAGNEARATEVLREVIRQYGESLEVTEKDYHPRLVRLFRKVRQEMLGSRTGVVVVTTPETGCQTLLDGRELPGLTPREYSGLFPGMHYLQVRCGGAESMIRRIQIGRERLSLLVDVPFEAAMTLDGNRLGLSFPDVQARETFAQPFARQFGEIVGADLVLLQGLDPDGELDARLIEVRTGQEVGRGRAPAKSQVATPSSVRAVVAAIQGREPTAAGARATSSPPPKPKKVRKGGATGWVVGSLVTAAGLGLASWAAYESAVWADARSQATKPYPDRDPGETDVAYLARLRAAYEQKVSDADRANRAATLAAVGWSVGGVATVTGVVLLVLKDRIFPSRSGGSDSLLMPMPMRAGGGLAFSISF